MEDKAMEDTTIKDVSKEIGVIKKGTSIEELKAKHGKIYQLDLTISPDDDTEVEVSYIFQRPNNASYDRYIKTASAGATKALKTFMLDNIIPEYKAKLEADLEEYPALTLSAGEKLLNMLGLSKSANLKML
jgi:isopenicillin N synthase-like dioxygenase